MTPPLLGQGQLWIDHQLSNSLHSAQAERRGETSQTLLLVHFAYQGKLCSFANVRHQVNFGRNLTYRQQAGETGD